MKIDVRVYVDEEKPLVCLQLTMDGDDKQFATIDLEEAAAKALVANLTAALHEKFGQKANDAEGI